MFNLCVCASVVLAAVLAQNCESAAFGSRDRPVTFLPPDGGPTLQHMAAPVGSVVYDFNFYHKSSYRGDGLFHFSSFSRANQRLASPIRVSIPEHDISDFRHPVIVWTFKDAASGRVLATTVVTEDVFNSTGVEQFHVPRPVVPSYHPDRSLSWLIGAELVKIPAPVITEQDVKLFNRWELLYKYNTQDGVKETTVTEPLNAPSSQLPGDIAKNTEYELTMRFCNSLAAHCSMYSPPLPIDLTPGQLPIPVEDRLIGTGSFTVDSPAWHVPYVPYGRALADDDALLEVDLYRVNLDGTHTHARHVSECPGHFPVVLTLPYAQYIGVWSFKDRSVNPPAFRLSSMLVYHHPPLHHRTSYPVIPVYSSAVGSWTVGPDPVSIAQPTSNGQGKQESFMQWSVHYEPQFSSTGAVTVREAMTTTSSLVPRLPAGNYRVTLAHLGSVLPGVTSAKSPPFTITIASSNPPHAGTSQQPPVAILPAHAGPSGGSDSLGE